MPAARTASLQSWAAPRWTWHSVLLAGLVTAAVFTGLPFLERLTHPPEKNLALRDVWDLAETVATIDPQADPGAPQVLARYASARRIDRQGGPLEDFDTVVGGQ